MTLSQMIEHCAKHDESQVYFQWLNKCMRKWQWKEGKGWIIEMATEGDVDMMEHKVGVVVWLPKDRVLEFLKQIDGKGGAK